MRKVLVGTPTLDGRVDAWYCDSLIRTVREGLSRDVNVQGVYTSYDSLIQRSRNSLVKIALNHNFDDLFFIDSDMEWDPEWFFNLLDSNEDIVGCPVVKKNDEIEGYNVRLLSKNLRYSNSGILIEVDGVGTGFIKLSREALQKLWDVSPPYFSEDGEENRMIFDIEIKNGTLISEDYVMCNKWKDLGNKIWVNPLNTCNHLGVKKYTGNFLTYLQNNEYK
jgi:glycosyltransferase involved in cell wall biosynthesis